MDTIELMWQVITPLKWWIAFVAAALIVAGLYETGRLDVIIDRLIITVRRAHARVGSTISQENHP